MRRTNNMERSLRFENFRNIGLDREQSLMLNKTVEKGKMGDLVILIGPNNSGKSNILDGLMSLNNKRLSQRDVTDLSYDDEKATPQVCFQFKDDSYIFNYVVSLNQDKCEATKIGNEEQISVKELNEGLCSVAKALQNHGYNNLVSEIMAFSVTTDASDDQIKKSFNAFKKKMEDIGQDSYFLRIFKQIAFVNKYVFPNSLENATTYMEEKYGIPFLPQVIRYQEHRITKNDLVVQSYRIGESRFFKALFKHINIDIKHVINGIGKYQNHLNSSILEKIESEINKKMKPINDRFNKMYFADQEKYKFSVRVESEKISLGISRGENNDPIMLDYQSTGFIWFFDLFFNFLCAEDLKPGAIIVMDEPATNLHPQGQKELRKFIKDFAVANDLTFVIATHSPFLIDVDNYDELRVISLKDNYVNINNLFTAVNLDDPDALLPIKQSLTIEQNVFYNLRTEVVWVEGMTDYNYLTMFKNLLGIENIAFLPFNGVGKDDNKQQQILNRLLSIDFHKKNLLVDSDKAGKSLKNKCADTAFSAVVSISDLNHDQVRFTEIEDLFSDIDKKKFPSLNASSDSFKRVYQTCIMKRTCKLDDFSDETINNFKQLFKLLTE